MTFEEAKCLCKKYHVRLPKMSEMKALQALALFNISIKGNHYSRIWKCGEIIFPSPAPMWVIDDENENVPELVLLGYEEDYEYLSGTRYKSNNTKTITYPRTKKANEQGVVHFILS